MGAPPVIDCPTCHAVVSVADDWCWSCEATFAAGLLRDRYDAQTEAVRAHYR